MAKIKATEPAHTDGSNMTMEDALHLISDMTQEQFDQLPPAWLVQMNAHLEAEKARALSHIATFAYLLNGRYGAKLDDIRTPGVEHGTVSLPDGGMVVKGERKKSVEWAAHGLQKVYDAIAKEGGDPARWITKEVSYKVSESDFAKWDAETRAPFEPHRTVSAGKQTIKIELPTAEKKGKGK